LAALVAIARPLLPVYAEERIVETLPVDAVDFIEENQLPRELFNSYNWGGYLIWRLYPSYPVFIDGRTDLYDDPFMRRYLRVSLARGDWQETLDEYGVNTILTERGGHLANVLTHVDEWAPLYADEMAVVFVRDTDANRAVIDAHPTELTR
jgi:hypothetical protein